MNARIGWQNLRTSEFLDSGDYLLITGTDFDNGRVKYSTCHYVEKKRFDQDTKIQISTGSILITKDGTVNDTLRMYKNDDIRMYNFNCITDTIVEVITTCNTYTLLTVHLL